MHPFINLVVIITVCTSIATCNRFDLHKILEPEHKLSSILKRLTHYELIPIIHKMNKIDTGLYTLYPTTASMEFNSFGNHYKLNLTKSTELFSKNFFTETHTFNQETQSIDKERTHHTLQCYYAVKVISDLISSSTHGMLSLCNEDAINGWIHAFGETIAIQPQSTDDDKQYLIYKYSDINRTHYRTINNPYLEHNIASVVPPKQHPQNRRQMQITTTRYVEFAVVIDPAMMEQYTSYDDNYLLDKTMSIMSQVQKTYLATDWGTFVGEIKIVLSAVYYVDSWNSQYAPDVSDSCPYNGFPSLFGADDDEYCEIEYSDYFYKFRDYAQNELDYADIAHLFSYYDFKDSIPGYASFPGVCIPGSAAINMMVYDEEYNALVVTVELAHNFGIPWDEPSCSSTFIMSASGSPYGYRPTSFSNCSIDYMIRYFEDDYPELRCLENEPFAPYAVCRNGIIEDGEGCDCGQSDCGSIDRCCDGEICQLYSNSECSNDDLCCYECVIKDAGEMCSNSYSSSDPCDIEVEYCDGESSECPPDLKHVEGTRCAAGDSFGYCYNGECISIEEQCESWSDNYTVASEICSNYPVYWQVPSTKCDTAFKCEGNDGECVTVTYSKPQDGTPCNLSDSLPAQCVNGECVHSSEMYTYLWTLYGWNDCSVDCKADNNASAGNQTRDVQCTFLNGTNTKNESLCSLHNKPFGVRACNNFVCANVSNFNTTQFEDEDGIKIEIDFSSIFFKGLLAVAAVTVCIILYCLVYICCASAMMKRIGLPGSQGFFKTIRILGFCGSVQFVFQISDVGTDYLYAVKLIMEQDEDVKMLGWISLFTAIIGLILFLLKILLLRKFIGYQVNNYKKELKTLSSTSPKAKEIMAQIRKRNIDIDTVSLLMSCMEDIPQSVIVVTLVHSNYDWDAISILNFAMSVSSFLWKFVQVMASKIGCKDPSNVFQSKRELELADNMETQSAAA